MLHPLLQTLALLILILTLPLALELLLLAAAFVFRERPRPLSADTGIPFRLAVILPAHNQSHSLTGTLQSLRIARDLAIPADIRILVLAHNCTDDTAALARAAGVESRILDGPPGKAAALAFAFHTIPAEGYLVLDPGTLVDPLLLQRVQSLLASGVEALQVRCDLLPPTTPAARLDALAFRATHLVRTAGRIRLRLSCGLLDYGFALRRSLLNQVPYTAWSGLATLHYHLRLVQARVRIRYLDTLSARTAISTPGARRQLARLRFGWSLFPSLLGQILVGRIRLLEPALDLTSLPFTPQAILLLAGLLIPFHPFRIYCLIALSLLILNLLTALFTGDEPRADLRALFHLPTYLFRKLRPASPAAESTPPA